MIQPWIVRGRPGRQTQRTDRDNPGCDGNPRRPSRGTEPTGGAGYREAARLGKTGRNAASGLASMHWSNDVWIRGLRLLL